MDCSGKADCNCNDCQDDYSDGETSSHGSGTSLPRILKELPKGAIPYNQYHQRTNNYLPPPRRNEFPCERPLTITAPVYPLTNIVGLDSGIEGKISISILRSNGMVIFAWETFRGQIGARGISSISLSTSLPYKPIYPVSVPIQLEYNGIGQIALITINPKEAIEQVKFFFSINSQKSAQFGDIVHINGSSVTYITQDY